MNIATYRAERVAKSPAAKSPRKSLLYTASALSLLAALIHVWAMLGNYQEWWGYGAFFLTLAAAQGSYSVALLRWSGQAVFLLGITGNLGIVLIYIGAVSVHIESVGLINLASKAIELALVIVLALLLRSYWLREPPSVMALEETPADPDELEFSTSAANRALRVAKPHQLVFPSLPKDVPLHTIIYWVLRISCAGNFIGHGTFGILGKQAWLPFWAFAGIGEEPAAILTRLVGVSDVSFGLMVLFKPMRLVLLYMTVWSFWTALLRPLTGLGWWELIERGGNYGPPFALLLYTGWGRSVKDWVRGIPTPALTENKIQQIKLVLRWSMALLLIGHGGLAAIQGKAMLIGHYASVGLPGPLVDPQSFLAATGWFEIALGAMVLISPTRPLLVVILLWKVFTELLYPISGIPVSEIAQGFYIFETIERFGDYGAPVGLFFLMTYGARWTKPKMAREISAEPAFATND